MKIKKIIIPLFILVYAIILSSCASSVSYTVVAEHEDKIKVIYNMMTGLLENDSELYLEAFEPEYIANVKKVVDTLGTQYFDAESFDDLISSFFKINNENLSANYGEKIKVKLSFNSVEEVSKDTLETFLDDYSVGYKFPVDKTKSVSRVSVRMTIASSDYNGTMDGIFTLLELEDAGWKLHPESFLYSF